MVCVMSFENSEKITLTTIIDATIWELLGVIIISDVRPIFIFAISNSYVLLSLLNTPGKPEKLYCTGFGQANAEIQRFEEH